MMNTFNLSRDASLIGVEVKLYSWSKQDKTAAQNAAQADSAESERYSTSVQRLTKEHRLPPQQIAGEARKIIAVPYGTPWDGKGLFLIPNVRLESTLRKLKECEIKFYEEVGKLISKLPGLEREARLELGDAYHRVGFPTAAEVKSKYSFTVRQSVVVDANDIRLSHVSDDVRRQIVESVKQEQLEQVASIHKTCVEALTGALSRVAANMRDFSEGKIARFENTVISNLEDMVENLPALNVTGDTVVEDTINRARALVRLMSKAEENKLLREKNQKGRETRKEIATTATSILGKLQAGVVTKDI